jgi:hypothetical protein
LTWSSSELDDVRPPVKSFDPSLWDNAESPLWRVETSWRSPSPSHAVPLWRSPSPPSIHDSMPSLVSVSDSEDSLVDGWSSSLDQSMSLLAGGLGLDLSVSRFKEDMDHLLGEVEEEVGGSLLMFPDDVVIHREGGLELLSQVVFRSLGPPGLAGVSVENPICIE